MNLQELIQSRRSVRIFSDKKLEPGVLEKIIKAGIYAPSHCNTQGWKFIFVNKQEIKNKIFESGGTTTIKKAPYGILVLYNTGLSDNLEYKDWIQSSSAAIQNMLLIIHNLGLGACWVCHLPRKKILKKIFNIQKPYSSIAYIAFGYPAQNTIEIPRKYKTDEFCAANKFIWPKEKISLNIYLKRCFRKIYFILPSFIKKIVHPFTDKFIKKFNN